MALVCDQPVSYVLTTTYACEVRLDLYQVYVVDECQSELHAKLQLTGLFP